MELKNTGIPVLYNFGVKAAIAFLISKWPASNAALKDSSSLRYDFSS